MIQTTIRGICQAIGGESKRYRRIRWRRMPAIVTSAMFFGLFHTVSNLGPSTLTGGAAYCSSTNQAH